VALASRLTLRLMATAGDALLNRLAEREPYWPLDSLSADAERNSACSDSTGPGSTGPDSTDPDSSTSDDTESAEGHSRWDGDLGATPGLYVVRDHGPQTSSGDQ
jgi:hypothetical protein